MEIKKYKAIVEKAIKESKLNGYKWKITDKGLWWSYSESEFEFHFDELEESEEDLFYVKDVLQNENIVWYFVGATKFCDYKDIESAIYAAVKATIENCNNTY